MLRWLDDFAHFQTADLPVFYPVNQVSGATVTVSTSVGRYDSGSLQFVVAASTASQSWYGRAFDAQATWAIGFALRFTALPTANRAILFRLMDGNSAQVELSLDSAGKLQVTRNGTAVTGGGPTTTALSVSTWYSVEMKCTIATSIAANSWQVFLDGVLVINVTAGQSSNNTGSATADRFRLGVEHFSSGNDSGTWNFDDLYLLDGQTGMTSLIYPWKVVSSLADGAGSNTSWSNDGGAGLNFDHVNNVAISGDASYVQSGTTGNRDTYAFAALPGSPSTVIGAQVQVYARMTDAGPRTIGDCCVSGSTTSDGTGQSLTGSFAVYAFQREKDPATSAAWSVANINAAEFGVKVVS